MRAFLKWLRRGVIALVVIAATAVGGGYGWLRGSLPQMDGERAVFGVAAPVEVVRDRHGIPHILARNEEDTLFALGFVHAQDRLWQMEMNRRIGTGRLAEVLGASAFGTDRLLRTLGLYRRAAATLPRLSPDARRRIAAYVNGVNAWLETREGPLPPEFLIVGFEPEPWTEIDTVVWAKVMALDLAGEWVRDLMRLRMSAFLAPEQILDFYTPYRQDMPRGVQFPGPPATTAVGEGSAPDAAVEPAAGSGRSGRPAHGSPAGRISGRTASRAGVGRSDRSERGSPPHGVSAPPVLPARPFSTTAGFAFPPRGGLPGSNSWAVAGAKSATGKPLLANDPHLGLTVPSVWYFAHLSWPGRDIVGATFPGMPLVVLGHNGRVAWGFTNTGADTQDIFLEKLDPQNPARYLTPAGYRRFEVHREVIKVKDAEDVVLRVRETRHGPVLDDASAAAAGASPPGHVAALGWAALRDDDLTVQAGLGLPGARDWASFTDNLRQFHSPPLNISYADVDGNIGFLVSGRIPVRPGSGPRAARPGMTPQPGWDGDHDWSGFIPFDALPRVYNPPGGALVTANHDVTPAGYPHHLSFEWAAGFRAKRILERLASRPRHDAESFRSLQQDRVSLFARALLPRLRGIDLGRASSALARRARDLLEGWEGDMDPERPEPLVFQAWIREFGRLVTADELGPVQRRAWGRKGTFLQRILETGEVWCDDLATRPIETCDEMLARALEGAASQLADRQGNDLAAWRWGREHHALAEHRPLASSPLAPLFNLGGPAPGGIYTVNSFEFSPFRDERPFTSTHGPSLRAIYDLSDLDRSLFIHATGQSGNVLSPLYDNFEEGWRNGEYVTIPTRREAFEAGALGRLRLVPP